MTASFRNIAPNGQLRKRKFLWAIRGGAHDDPTVDAMRKIHAAGPIPIDAGTLTKAGEAPAPDLDATTEAIKAIHRRRR